MTTRFGYACLNMSLCAQKPKVFCSRSMIKRTFQAKGIDYASELALANTFDLIKYVAWNNAHGVKVFRVTSCMFPWASEYRLEDLPHFESIVSNLEFAGQLARDNGQRLSMHPGQFNVLTSEKPHVVENCITTFVSTARYSTSWACLVHLAPRSIFILVVLMATAYLQLIAGVKTSKDCQTLSRRALQSRMMTSQICTPLRCFTTWFISAQACLSYLTVTTSSVDHKIPLTRNRSKWQFLHGQRVSAHSVITQTAVSDTKIRKRRWSSTVTGTTNLSET